MSSTWWKSRDLRVTIKVDHHLSWKAQFNRYVGNPMTVSMCFAFRLIKPTTFSHNGLCTAEAISMVRLWQGTVDGMAINTNGNVRHVHSEQWQYGVRT
jgi:hypothetical protein